MIRTIEANEVLELLHADFFAELAVEKRRLDIHLMSINQVLR